MPELLRARGRILQVKEFADTAVKTGTTTIPIDTSIPRNTEGTEFMAATISPLSATSKLKIDVGMFLATSSNYKWIPGCLFRDNGSDAIAVAPWFTAGTNGSGGFFTFSHVVDSLSTSETTFKVRVGANASSTVYFNRESLARTYGEVAASGITITEFEP